MKRLFPLLLYAGLANASVLEGTAQINSNYIYRGMSVTNRSVLEPAYSGIPAGQLSLSLSHQWFSANFLTGNINTWDAVEPVLEPDGEVDASIGFTLPIPVRFSVNSYNYLINTINNSIELAASVGSDVVWLNASINNLPGWGMYTTYLQLCVNPPITESVSFAGHVGYNTLSSTDWGYGNYLDYRFGIVYSEMDWRVEVNYTNTVFRYNYVDDRYIDTDNALSFVVAHTFEFLKEHSR